MGLLSRLPWLQQMQRAFVHPEARMEAFDEHPAKRVNHEPFLSSERRNKD